MTIEELLNCSADQLEKMSDAELEAHFAPYLNVTRPERVIQEGSNNRISKPSVGSRKQSIEQSAAYRKAQEIAAQYGLKF